MRSPPSCATASSGSCWRYETRDGKPKPTKVPYQPTAPDTHASSTDPGTWGAFDPALAVAEAGKADGVGYVFAPDDPFAGVDFDGCVEADRTHPVVVEHVRQLDSYSEVSPSGTGLHVLVRGAIRGDRNRTGKTPWGGEFETYDRHRYFCFTGRHMPGTPVTIEERQAQLDAIRAELFPPPMERPTPAPPRTTGTPDDDELLRRARDARNGATFDALWSGAPGRNPSEADLALCNLLAFWAGPDPGHIDRLFRQSGLMRDKWDSPRGESTYGRDTIEKALNGRTEFYIAGDARTNGTGPQPGVVRHQPAPEHHPSTDPPPPRSALCNALTARLKLVDGITALGAEVHGSGLTAIVTISLSNGETIEVDRYQHLLQPQALGGLVIAATGNPVTFTGRECALVAAAVTKLSARREQIGANDLAREWGIAFLRATAANAIDLDMSDQAERWAAFHRLDDIDPMALSRVDQMSVAAHCVVLRDLQGTRYVHSGWYQSHIRRDVAPTIGPPELVNRMCRVGWDRSGQRGRIKATNPARKEVILLPFYRVPAGWEES